MELVEELVEELVVERSWWSGGVQPHGLCVLLLG